MNFLYPEFYRARDEFVAKWSDKLREDIGDKTDTFLSHLLKAARANLKQDEYNFVEVYMLTFLEKLEGQPEEPFFIDWCFEFLNFLQFDEILGIQWHNYFQGHPESLDDPARLTGLRMVFQLETIEHLVHTINPAIAQE